MKPLNAQIDLAQKGSPAKAVAATYFFKTGKGQYGYGDKFIGVTVPEIRLLAKKYQTYTFNELVILLKSAVHEERLLALIILVGQYERVKKGGDESAQKKIIAFYLKYKKHINNWDLVDQSAYKILGDYCYRFNQTQILLDLANSPFHFEKRIAMVATLAYIRAHEFKLTYTLAQKFFTESEDLMHKATGWMLREAGKKDETQLKLFLNKYANKMPRTMLRYSIEKFSAKIREEYLVKSR